MASGDNIITIRDEHGRYLKGMRGGPGRPVGSRNKLTEDFLRDLQADWEQHGKKILEVMREKHPEIYFQCMVKLALAHPVELYSPSGPNRQYTPEEIMAKLEERVGPEGRKMFERFLRQVRRLEEQQLTMSPADAHYRTVRPASRFHYARFAVASASASGSAVAAEPPLGRFPRRGVASTSNAARAQK
jgi:hypothetical protein